MDKSNINNNHYNLMTPDSDIFKTSFLFDNNNSHFLQPMSTSKLNAFSSSESKRNDFVKLSNNTLGFVPDNLTPKFPYSSPPPLPPTTSYCHLSAPSKTNNTKKQLKNNNNNTVSDSSTTTTTTVTTSTTVTDDNNNNNKKNKNKKQKTKEQRKQTKKKKRIINNNNNNNIHNHEKQTNQTTSFIKDISDSSVLFGDFPIDFDFEIDADSFLNDESNVGDNHSTKIKQEPLRQQLKHSPKNALEEFLFRDRKQHQINNSPQMKAKEKEINECDMHMLNDVVKKHLCENMRTHLVQMEDPSHKLLDDDDLSIDANNVRSCGVGIAGIPRIKKTVREWEGVSCEICKNEVKHIFFNSECSELQQPLNNSSSSSSSIFSSSSFSSKSLLYNVCKCNNICFDCMVSSYLEKLFCVLQKNNFNVEHVLAFDSCINTCPLCNNYTCMRSAKKIITSVYDSVSSVDHSSSNNNNNNNTTNSGLRKKHRKSKSKNKKRNPGHTYANGYVTVSYSRNPAATTRRPRKTRKTTESKVTKTTTTQQFSIDLDNNTEETKTTVTCSSSSSSALSIVPVYFD